MQYKNYTDLFKYPSHNCTRCHWIKWFFKRLPYKCLFLLKIFRSDLQNHNVSLEDLLVPLIAVPLFLFSFSEISGRVYIIRYFILRYHSTTCKSIGLKTLKNKILFNTLTCTCTSNTELTSTVWDHSHHIWNLNLRQIILWEKIIGVLSFNLI